MLIIKLFFVDLGQALYVVVMVVMVVITMTMASFLLFNCLRSDCPLFKGALQRSPGSESLGNFESVSGVSKEVFVAILELGIHLDEVGNVQS